MGFVDLADGLFDFLQITLVLADVGARRHQKGEEFHAVFEFGAARQHLFVGAETADDVFVGFGAVDADDVVFAGLGFQPGFVFQRPGGFGDALHFLNVDGSGVDADGAAATVQFYRPGYTVDLSIRQKLLYGVQETTSVLGGLEAYNVGSA